MKKERVMIEKVFLLIFGVIILSAVFVYGAHLVIVAGGTFVTNFSSWNETSTKAYNLTINNSDINISDSIRNITILLPTSFRFTVDSDNSTFYGNSTFSNLTAYTLQWYANATAPTNTGFINGTVNNSNFSFNASATIPGVYNITIITTSFNGTSNTTNISVEINDTTPPSAVEFVSPGIVYTSNYINLSQNSIPVNISVTDEGLTALYTNISNVNITLSYSNGTIINSSNATGINSSWYYNFTGLVDGNYTVNASVRDSAKNTNNSLNFNITLDTTAPGVAHSCTPTSVNIGQTITCTCTATDVGTGITSITQTANPDTSTVGTFTTTCDAIDRAGNNATQSSISYEVITSGVAPGTGGGGTIYTKTYVVTDEQFIAGHTQEVKINEKLRIKIKGETHNVGITALSVTTATISVFSTPQTATISVGGTRNFDVNADNYYDFSIKLESIENNKAKVVITSINELVTDETIADEKNKEDAGVAAKESDLKAEKGLTWLWIVVIVLVLIGAGIGYKKYKK